MELLRRSERLQWPQNRSGSVLLAGNDPTAGTQCFRSGNQQPGVCIESRTFRIAQLRFVAEVGLLHRGQFRYGAAIHRKQWHHDTEYVPRQWSPHVGRLVDEGLEN